MAVCGGDEVKVHKTIKLFIGGKFARTESGRSYQIKKNGTDEIWAELCLGSRKDLRNAVDAAKKGWGAWSAKTAFNRSQILYRMAEMAQSKKDEFLAVDQEVFGINESQAESHFEEIIDTFFYYAGFCDKYQQLTASVNPVSGPQSNVTGVDSMGVVVSLTTESQSILELVRDWAAALCAGNSVVAILPGQLGAWEGVFSEVFATSDLPEGAINLLSGDLHEIAPHAASHMEVNGISCRTSLPELKDWQVAGTENMKRFLTADRGKLSLDRIVDFCEYKTIWHPQGF